VTRTRLTRLALLFFSGGALLLTAYYLRAALIPFILALFLTYLLSPPVDYLTRRGLRRVYAIIVVYLLVTGLVVGLGASLIPQLLAELDRLVTTIPGVLRQVQDIVQQVQADYTRVPLPESVRRVLDDTIAGLQESLLTFLGGIVQGVIDFFPGVLSLVLAPVLAFYLLKDLSLLKRRALELVPARHRREVVRFAGEVDEVLAGFVRGQLTVALLVAVLVSTGLSLVGLRFALAFGLFAGLTEIIPYFGPVIGAVPPVLLALVRSPWLALRVVIVFIVVQQLESAIVSPRIVGKNVGLHPLFVIFALLVGGQLGGFWGLILAVPVAAVVRVVLLYLYRRVQPQGGSGEAEGED